MKYFILVNILFLLLTANVYSEDFKEMNDLGVKAYNSENYDSSLQYFQNAQELNPESKVVDFNLGNALHQQGQYEQALKNYENSAILEDSLLNSQAYYNIGNTQYRAGALDKAVEAYKKSLDYNPDDEDTKYNLELAINKLEEQQQQQQEQCDNPDDKEKEEDKDQDDQNKDKKQDQDKKDQKEDQEKDQEQKQDQEKKDDQKEDQQDQQKQDQDEQKEEEQQNQQDQEEGKEEESEPQNQPQDQTGGEEERPMQLDEQRAQALLEGLNEDEKEVLKKLIQQKVAASAYKGKNW
jgi:Ca-activated chloride channel homolog